MSDSLVGRVFRKAGPCGWLRAEDENFGEGNGIKGVSIRFRNMGGGWQKLRYFVPCTNPDDFLTWTSATNRYEEEAR